MNWRSQPYVRMGRDARAMVEAHFSAHYPDNDDVKWLLGNMMGMVDEVNSAWMAAELESIKAGRLEDALRAEIAGLERRLAHYRGEEGDD